MNAAFEKIKRIYSASAGPIFIVGCFWIHVWFVWFFLRIGIIPIAVLSTISCIVYLMPLVMKRENLEQNVIFLATHSFLSSCTHSKSHGLLPP